MKLSPGSARHTRGPLTVRIDGTCSGAWAEIGQECVDPVTKQAWWRELGRTETTHIARTAAGGQLLPGPVGTIDEKPERFKLTDDGQEHIANAHLWAAAPDLMDFAVLFVDTIHAVENRCMAVDGPVTPTHQEITDEELRNLYAAARGAMAKATGNAS